MTRLALAAAVILLGAVIATIRRQQAARRRAAVQAHLTELAAAWEPFALHVPADLRLWEEEIRND